MDPSSGFNFTSKLHDDTYDFIDPKKLDLSGKNVLISGASRGVGKAMAISFAKAGASAIALAARTSLDEVASEVTRAAKDAGRSAPMVLTLKVDTTSLQDVEAAAHKIASEFNGKLDVLINNAGYLETFRPVAESDPDDWWKTFEVNVKGVYLMTRSFLPLVLKSETKTIIQVSSIGAHIITHGASSYQTTKLAVLRFNNFLMNEHRDDGLVAYGIHPGAVATDLAKGMPEASHAILTDKPEVCGDTVAWLASEKRGWLADRYVSVTWDMEELMGKKDEIVAKDLLKVKMRV